MSNPKIKATTPLDEILKITSEYSCNCRSTYCCYNPPFLFEGEAQQVLDYLGAEDFDKFFNKKIVSFKEGYMPKEYKSLCIFAVRKGEKQVQLEEIESKIERPIETVKEKAIRMFHILGYFLKEGRMECGIQEIKPMQCKIYHCRMPKEIKSREIEYFYVNRDDIKTIEEFRKDVSKLDLPVLEGSVLQG